MGVDAFRGGVLALMLLTPAVGGDTLPLLRHAEWDGLTVSDCIFPAFLFTSGASLAFLLRPPVTADVGRRLVRRVVALLVLGVLYNAWGTTGADLSAVRLTGVLQLIGLTGGLAAVVVRATRTSTGADRSRWVAWFTVALVAAYGIGLAVLPGCSGDRCSPYHRVDVRVLGSRHLYAGGTLGYDPEGLVVVLAATALPLVGYLVGRSLASPVAARTVARIAGAGAALVALGLLLHLVQPVNKRLHTPAFTAVTAGIAMIGLAVALAVFDLDRSERNGVRVARALAAAPFTTLGRNALVVYLAERILTQAAAATTVGGVTLDRWLLEHALPFDGAADHLAYGALVLAVVLAITTVMRLLRWHVAL